VQRELFVHLPKQYNSQLIFFGHTLRLRNTKQCPHIFHQHAVGHAPSVYHTFILADIMQRFQSTFGATVAMLTTLFTSVTALPASTIAQWDGPMCKVEAQAHHSIGGGSTTQAPLDVVTGALI